MSSRILALVAGTALALAAAGSGRALAADAPADSAAKAAPPVTYSVETTASWHFVDHAYFGGADRQDDWGEAFSRVRVGYGLPAGASVGVGGVVMGTIGKDYYGAHDVADGRLDQLFVSVPHVGGSGLALVAGRQDLVLGDGFLIGDGYRDTRAALWNIPLNFYDALRADYDLGKVHALAFGANLSRSFGGNGVYPRGTIAGAELAWNPDADNTLALAYLRRDDTGPSQAKPTAFSLRGSHTHGLMTLAGEGVLEAGDVAGVSQRGKGGHLRLDLAPKAKYQPVLKLEYFYYSGDGTTPNENEAFDPWQYRWNDWSQYYVGDLVASTIGTASDMRIARVQLGLAPREGTGLRLLAHRMDLDTGARFALAPGASKAFAYEYDGVVDQAVGKHLTAWVMGGLVTPLDAARAAYPPGKSSAQVFCSATYKFGNAGSD